MGAREQNLVFTAPPSFKTGSQVRVGRSNADVTYFKKFKQFIKELKWAYRYDRIMVGKRKIMRWNKWAKLSSIITIKW